MTGTAAAAVALAVFLVGLATAFGWRTVALRRATGTTGYRGISGRPGLLHWWGGVLFAVAPALGVEPAERTALVTGGLFAHVRNPVFTGMLAVTAGLVGMVPTALSVLALVCLFAAVQIQVRAVEESYLVATHGPAYRDYAARAGRFLPGIGRIRSVP